ncbi:TonB-linked outer membrane protein, SusC/RagA family [Chitinophaga costaii]|uniref:TonB-linked outer membrane protein, SusC/RagA family n=1 Tax=Chitinophaga costaii TaxID=1335309 RepID=A0A1C4AUE8_9BACT|nr:TonB-dependent receptor [Chitinophaga costaii]PUZ26743.1 SusC/RagA family TonB-linked outer membrane protein [Chitinophaga costaii]SCB98088.1 TonB-linked outer membrane protein, SusC/RagA family [Chitinophaga costaii]
MYRKIPLIGWRGFLSTRRYAFLKMKLTLIVFMSSLLQVAAASYGQSVTLNVKNAPFDQLLDDISRQSGYHFLFAEQLLNKSTPVTLHVVNMPLQQVLAKCFTDQPFTYVIKENNVIITGKAENTKPPNAEAITVTGLVTDEKGQALPGVSVAVKGTKQGTVTAPDGKYHLSGLQDDAVLIFSFVGYSPKEVPVAGQTTINVMLTPLVGTLNDVVVVGYGTQKKATLIGSVASVKGEALTQAPVASTINSLAGRLPGLVSKQSTGQPGADQASINIRGFGQAIWIVDGVESNFNNIDPNQIESLSILKDGAASIYGARAGNGVILVTTKRGKEGKPSITANSSYTLQSNTLMSKPVNSGQYAEITNLFYANQGKPEPYTKEQVQKYYAGTDPAYPNTDWQKVATRTWAPETQQNLSVQGGTSQLKYFGFFGYLNQLPMWKNHGGGYNRYNLQSNLDAQINQNLSIQLLLSAVSETNSQPVRGQGVGGNTLWQDLWNSLPIYPEKLPDPTKYSYANGQGVGSIALVSNENIAGYDRSNSQNMKGTFIINYQIPAISGLSAKAFINYDKTYVTDKNFSKPYSFYTYDYSTQAYTLAGSLGSQAKLTYQESQTRNITGQLSLNYEHVFNKDHHITALALYEAIDNNYTYIIAGREKFLTPVVEELYAGLVSTSVANSSASQMGRASYVGRLNYAYKEKYLFESSLRADASAKFDANKRWGYFPSFLLGWRMEQEEFIKNLNIVDELKLKLSYGASGIDDVGSFQYLTGYQFGGQWLIGNGTQAGIVSTGLANPNLTWEKVNIYNAAVDFSLFNRKLFGTAEVFYRTLSGIPATRIQTLPNTFGAALPSENLNSQNNRGFEFVLGTNGHIGELSYQVSANISWSRARWDHYEEPVYTDPDQERISKNSGKWVDRAFGYLSDGLFTSQKEIDDLKFTYPGGNAALRPGDVKYIDRNGDGKLDYKDQQQVGTGTVPNWMTGATVDLRYKGFDMQCLLQGAFNYYSTVYLYHNGLNYSEAFYKNMWTEQNNSAYATPRISGASSNSFFSDIYYKKTSYMRLKALALGYTLPKQLLIRAGIRQLRVYVAGTNLLTINPLKKYDIDPEAPSGQATYYYPQQRTVSIGLNLTL